MNADKLLETAVADAALKDLCEKQRAALIQARDLLLQLKERNEELESDLDKTSSAHGNLVGAFARLINDHTKAMNLLYSISQNWFVMLVMPSPLAKWLRDAIKEANEAKAAARAHQV